MNEHTLIEHMRWFARWISNERERMGFVWAGDMEQDPRTAGGPRVAWGRMPNNDLYVLDLEADPSWEPLSDEQWDSCYPHAGHPPHLPGPDS